MTPLRVESDKALVEFAGTWFDPVEPSFEESETGFDVGSPPRHADYDSADLAENCNKNSLCQKDNFARGTEDRFLPLGTPMRIGEARIVESTLSAMWLASAP